MLISATRCSRRSTNQFIIWADRPYDDPLRLYLDSLTALRPLPPIRSCCVARPAVSRLPARPDALRAHHDERMAETLDALGEPRTAEAASGLFRARSTSIS